MRRLKKSKRGMTLTGLPTAPYMRRLIKNKSGMTLIEMLAAFAIVVVAATVLMTGVQLIFTLSIEAETRKQSQTELTALAAANATGEAGERSVVPGALTLPGGHEIAGAFVTYEKDGVSFTLFEADGGAP